jgi:hypothetical protein
MPTYNELLERLRQLEGLGVATPAPAVSGGSDARDVKGTLFTRALASCDGLSAVGRSAPLGVNDHRAQSPPLATMSRKFSAIFATSGSRHDQDIPLNYDSSYCRIVLTQTYAGMVGPTGSFPYNTLVLAFHLTLQPAGRPRMTLATLELKFEVPTATDKCIVRASLVFRDRQDSSSANRAFSLGTLAIPGSRPPIQPD